jgi:hypothetical protein
MNPSPLPEASYELVAICGRDSLSVNLFEYQAIADGGLMMPDVAACAT